MEFGSIGKELLELASFLFTIMVKGLIIVHIRERMEMDLVFVLLPQQNGWEKLMVDGVLKNVLLVRND